MTQLKSTPLFPATIRAKPEYLVGELGRQGVNYLTDRLFRSLVWGAPSEAPGGLKVVVSSEGALKIKRTVSTACPLLVGDESLMADCYQRCLTGLNAGAMDQYAWVEGNPFQTIFLPVAVALSSQAKVTVKQGGYFFSQSYSGGVENGPVVRTSSVDNESYLELEIRLDSQLLKDEFQAYPFRIRFREFASLIPGLDISLKYKAFKEMKFLSHHGLTDLLDFFVPLEDRLHERPFVFRYRDQTLEYECCLYLLHAAMERIKSFIDFDESYNGGVHERLLRKTVRHVVRRISGLEIPVRRQSIENIACSRMSYFGQFGSTVPYHQGQSKSEQVRTLPGVAAAIRVCSPELESDTNFRARLVGPNLEPRIGPDLTRAFRTWLLQQRDTVDEWRKQWQPKKRKKAKPSN